MPNGSITKTWLEQELAAVVLKLAEVEAAKVSYLASYDAAKARLENGRAELLNVLQNY